METKKKFAKVYTVQSGYVRMGKFGRKDFYRHARRKLILMLDDDWIHSDVYPV